MRHALVEILDIGINTGSSRTDYAAPHQRRRLLEADAVQKAPARVAEHKLAHVKALW